MTDDTSDTPGDPQPKLTIGQRILTALPNLQRESPAPAAPARPTPKASSGPASGKSPARTTGGSRDRVDDADALATDDRDSDAGADTDDDPDDEAPRQPSPTRSRARPGEDLDTMTREEITHRIKRLDDRERFLALSSAPLGAAVGVLLTILAIHLNPPLLLHGKLNAKHESTSLILLEGGARILLSGIVVAAALSRRRSLVGFSLLFLGTAMGSPLFALPFWVLGGYLIWRVFKYQRVLTARGGTQSRQSRQSRPSPQARAPGGKRVPANPGDARRAGVSAARERAQSRRTKKQPAPTGPPPSKRYTPPRPVRPRPPAPPS
jgi:hypothetical protein